MLIMNDGTKIRIQKESSRRRIYIRKKDNIRVRFFIMTKKDLNSKKNFSEEEEEDLEES